MRHLPTRMPCTFLAAWMASLLAGCLDDGARDLDAFLSDPAYLESIKGEVDAAAVGPLLCSEVGNGAPWQGSFQSKADVPLGISWVRPDCGEDTLAQLEPGATYTFTSSIGQVWRARTLSGDLVYQVKLTDTSPVLLVIEVNE